jgi:signal transduction histidine kinase
MDAKVRAAGVHRNTPKKEPPVPPQGDSRSLSRGTRRTPLARYARPNVSVASRSTAATRSARSIRLPVARDAALAAVAFGLTLAMLAHGSGGTRTLDALGVVLAVAACLPLLVHRRWPLGVFVVCAVASATIEGLGYALGPPFGPTVALFYLAVDQRTPDRLRQTATTVVALGAIHVGVAAATTSGFPTTAILGAIIIWGGAWIVGDQVRQRRQRLADLRDRAERSERETARERRLAVAEERNRIARDLHDSAAHAINVILVQAGGARLLQDRDPGAVSAALSTIEDVARETIEDIDQLIHGLRTTDESDQTTGPVELPTGLASMPTLLERHHAAGMTLDMQVDGSPRPLAPGPDQAAYRILQESLTNAARHGTGPVEVRIAYGQRQLELTISNPMNGNGAGEPVGRGYGILGMRERAALLGGGLHASVRDGLFQVTASLPYAAAARAR